MDKRLEAVGRLLDIMDELREKCPWDRKQTFDSLRMNTIEETYELADAILDHDLNEIRKELGDLLLHVVDISHPRFEDQIAVVKQTLQEIGAGDKPVYLVFNKIDAYTWTEKADDDLTPATDENRSLDDLKQSWIAKANTPCIFLSAKRRTNIDKFRQDLYGMVREIHAGRYPFNHFLY